MNLKKLTALALAALCVLPLGACSARPAVSETAEVQDNYGQLTATAEGDLPYAGKNVFGVSDEKAHEIWAWAEQCYQEWYARYQEMLTAKEKTVDAALIQSNFAEWSKGVYSDPNWNYENFQESGGFKYNLTRTLSTLQGWTTCTQKSTEYLTDPTAALWTPP